MAPNTTTWKLEAHTEAKHAILRRYLGAWYPKLANRAYNRRLIFLDGFCGPGVYEGGEKGSPIIALETLVNHTAFSRWNATEFLFLFFDDDQRRIKRLETVVEEFWLTRGGQPRNVKVEIEHTDFASGATEILKRLGDGNLAPTFAFVDPFGVKGISMKLMADLLDYDKCELFVNFIYDTGVCRWLEQLPSHMNDLFGTNVWRQAAGLSGEERKSALRKLYQSQLQVVARFTYTQSFEMVNDRGRTAYYLFYGTRSLEGLKAMKYAMWKVDPLGGVKFVARLAGQEVLFTEDQLNTTPLRVAIIEQFTGEAVLVDDVEEFVLTKTPYRETHYKNQVLRPLEREGLLSAAGPRRRGTFPSGTRVTFS